MSSFKPSTHPPNDAMELAKTLPIVDDEHPMAETILLTETNADPPPLGETAANLLRTTMLPRVEVVEGRLEVNFDPQNRYEEMQPLGEGGMGEVLLVHDNDIKRRVAMKRLKDPGHKGALMRFLDEIKTVGRLEHPNIVPIYDTGRDEAGSCYFIMKYVEGETLRDVIDKLQEGDAEYHERYPFEVRIQVFQDILQAMHYAHTRGIVHRDLKPENIMIGRFGEVKVMDWGIARVMDNVAMEVNPEAARELPTLRLESVPLHETLPERLSQTRQGTMMGTPAYMAPEQALEGNVDERTDIYALSMLLYEMLTLQHCFPDKKNATAMLMAVVTEEPTFASFLQNKHQGRVPPEWAHFLTQGLRKDPNERFQSVEEMLATLQIVQSGQYAAQCPVTLAKSSGNKIGRIFDSYPQQATMFMLAICVSFPIVLLLALYGFYTLVS